MQRQIKKRGFTLIELIVALAVLGIIIIAFINMFSTAIFGVFRAGDKGTAYTLAKEDVETRIARGETVSTEALSITFGGKTFSIEGGLVETHKFVRNSESEIAAFVPLVPVVEIEPKVNHEGALKPITLTVTGQRTHFSNNSKAQVLNKYGDVIQSNISVSATNPTTASLQLNMDLFNNQSDYIIRIISPVTGKPDEIVRAKYSVYFPNLIAVGTNEIYVSADGSYWLERSAPMNFPSFSQLRSVAFGELSIVAVGDNGTVLTYSEDYGWERNTILGTENLTGIAWNDVSKKYYVVGDAGTIRSSSNGKNWTQNYSDPTIPLRAVSVTGTGRIYAVGNQGTILYSTDGNSWQTISLGVANALNSVMAFDNSTLDYFVAVGDGGVIFRSDDGLAWSQVTNPDGLSRNLNDIAQKGGSMIAVGSGGAILVSTDVGTSWQSVSYTTQDLYSIVFMAGSNDIFVSGDGVILKSTTMSMISWVVNETILGEQFRGLASK